MKSLLAVLALAIVLSAGYWKLRNPDTGIAGIGSQAAGQVGLVSSTLGFGKANTSKLEAELASSQSQLQETAVALEANRAELEEAIQRLATIESQLKESDERLDATEQAVASASSAIENQGSAVDQRLQAIDSKVDRSLSGSSRLGPVEQQLASLETRIDALKDEITQTNSANTEQLTQRLESDLTSRFTAQQTAVAGLQASFNNSSSEFSQQLQAQTLQVESLEQKLNSIEAKAEETAQATANSATAADISNINQQLAELQTDVSTTEETLTNGLSSALDEKLASLSSSFEEKRKIDADNQTRLLRQSVNRMDNQIKAISAASGEAGAALELSSALDDRINEVENSLASIDQNPSLLRMERSISARIDSVDSSIKDLSSSVDNTIEEMGSSLGSLEASYDEVSQSVAEVKQTIASVENSVASMEQSVTSVEDNLLTKVSEDTSILKEQLDVARKKVAVLEAEMKSPADTDEINTRLATLDQRLGSLESDQSLAQISAETAKMKEQLDVSRKKVAVLEAQIKTPADSSVTDTAIDTQLAAIDQRINLLETNGVALAAALPQDENAGDLGPVVALLAQRLEQAEQKLTNLPVSTGAVTVNNQASEQLQQKIADLENRLSQSQTAPLPDERLVVEVDKLNQKLSALEEEKLAAANAEPQGKPYEYKIYFGKDSDSISDDAEKVLKSFIAQEQNRAGSVSIFGFTDRSGNAAYNQRLALRRANGVRSFLIQQGFDFRKINAVDGLGEDPAASKIDDGKEDANQRTVVLYAYPQ